MGVSDVQLGESDQYRCVGPLRGRGLLAGAFEPGQRRLGVARMKQSEPGQPSRLRGGTARLGQRQQNLLGPLVAGGPEPGRAQLESLFIGSGRSQHLGEQFRVGVLLVAASKRQRERLAHVALDAVLGSEFAELGERGGVTAFSGPKLRAQSLGGLVERCPPSSRLGARHDRARAGDRCARCRAGR